MLQSACSLPCVFESQCAGNPNSLALLWEEPWCLVFHNSPPKFCASFNLLHNCRSWVQVLCKKPKALSDYKEIEARALLSKGRPITDGKWELQGDDLDDFALIPNPGQTSSKLRTQRDVVEVVCLMLAMSLRNTDPTSSREQTKRQLISAFLQGAAMLAGNHQSTYADLLLSLICCGVYFSTLRINT